MLKFLPTHSCIQYDIHIRINNVRLFCVSCGHIREDFKYSDYLLVIVTYFTLSVARGPNGGAGTVTDF